MPRGVVSPRYWGDGAAFGGQAKPDWAFHPERKARKVLSARALLLASL
jgi:hypothetical protein